MSEIISGVGIGLVGTVSRELGLVSAAQMWPGNRCGKASAPAPNMEVLMKRRRVRSFMAVVRRVDGG